MTIVEAGNIAKMQDGKPLSGIIIYATREEISSLPFNPYGAEVKLVKVDAPKKAEKPHKKEHNDK